MNALIRRLARLGLVLSLALGWLTPPAFCATWIVDINNGPGTNFTSISAAIAAAAPGDVIIVRQGAYGTFALTRGMTILGQGNVYVFAAGTTVSGIPAGEVAVLSNLRIGAPTISSCAGTVVLQRFSDKPTIQNCADVRARQFDIHLGLTIVNSRVQIDSSQCKAYGGAAAQCTLGSVPAGTGGTGISCTGASRVHFVASTAVGGQGGSGEDCFTLGGPGGTAIGTSGPASGMLDLILTGSQVLAGIGGIPSGQNGRSLVVGPNVTAWSAQTSYSPTPPQVYPGGTLNQLATIEPTLELIGNPAPGATVTLVVRAAPGVSVRLNTGRTPVVQPAAGILIENLVINERAFDLGTTPASGVIGVPWPFRVGAPIGQMVIFQAKVTDPVGNVTKKTNSIEAIVQ